MEQASQYQPGDVLAGTVYRVVRHLATGGMGSVYEVEDVTVEKRYVLKTLHPNLIAREDLALRMRDEAKSLARLQHPNIVDVVTAGVTSDAQKMPFYVMERLIGQNLRVVLEKTGALHVPHAYRIAIDVADALEHAHENAIVHRDVKPENIFLHRNANGTTTTKLLDFGIVRLLDRKASNTRGKFIGTLRYASPEQITGAKVGPATDIYSLGAVLFEMLCGRGPFDDAGDAYAIGAAHANTPAPPLSRFVRGVAPDVERLVASALAKSPEERPRDCFAFASELRRILREEEAAPRSATAVNLLTAASPPTTVHREPEEAEPTERGMIPPSLLASTPAVAQEELAPTQLEHRGEVVAAPVSPIAPTVAAEGVVTPPMRITPAAPRAIDRSAPTRTSAPPLLGSPRAAPNDTQMVESGLADARAVQSAFSAPAPPAPPARVEVAFAPPEGAATTGPLSTELRGRPGGDRGPLLLVGAAAVLAVAMVGGALFAVRRAPASPVATGASASPSPLTADAAAAGAAVVSASAAPAPSPVVPPPIASPASSARMAPAVPAGRGNRAAPSTAPRAPTAEPAASARPTPPPGPTPASPKEVPFDP